MAYETEPPHTSSCLRGKRIVLIGDSTSRYEYAQLALSLLGADSAQMSPNPLDVSVFYRIPPRGNESTLMPKWARSTLKSPGCPAYETQSKWASIMRYLHGMIGDLEICDCSPGPTLCWLGAQSLWAVKTVPCTRWMQTRVAYAGASVRMRRSARASF